MPACLPYLKETDQPPMHLTNQFVLTAYSTAVMLDTVTVILEAYDIEILDLLNLLYEAYTQDV